MKSILSETELENKQRKEVHMFYTNVPTRLRVYRNTTVKTFVRELIY